MKEFNLEAALNGEPVMLRNGEKAYIFKNIQDTHILNFKVDYPLIGMWEEPKKQISIEDLPKPFYPEESSDYFYILDGKVIYNSNYCNNNIISRQRTINGQCFRTREDAQKWLDFMKSMMEQV